MVERREEKVVMCRCPYCDVEVEPESAICVACKMVIIECVNCGAAVRKDAENCPGCGKPPK
ncbi:MAG: double zinc ribbon domain-containing protein [Candidatus Geothermincolia bacterium]